MTLTPGQISNFAFGSIIYGIILIVLLPILLHNQYKFWQCRELDSINKRYPQITSITCVIVTTYLLFQRPFAILNLFGMSNHFSDDSESFDIIIDIITTIFGVIVEHGILYTILWRFFMIYYNIRWTVASLSSHWRLHLNPNSVQLDFYLTHNKTLGNFQWVGLRLFVIWFISVLIASSFKIAMYYPSNDKITIFTVDLIDVILKLIPITLCFYIWKKTPIFYDDIHIRSELNIINIENIILLICELFSLIKINNDITFYQNIFLLVVSTIAVWSYVIFFIFFVFFFFCCF